MSVHQWERKVCEISWQDTGASRGAPCLIPSSPLTAAKGLALKVPICLFPPQSPSIAPYCLPYRIHSRLFRTANRPRVISMPSSLKSFPQVILSDLEFSENVIGSMPLSLNFCFPSFWEAVLHRRRSSITSSMNPSLIHCVTLCPPFPGRADPLCPIAYAPLTVLQHLEHIAALLVFTCKSLSPSFWSWLYPFVAVIFH